MTARQERFCQEFIASGNATQSAIKAGYSDKNAKTQGARLLMLDEVKQRIKELQTEVKNDKILDAIQMQEVLTSIILKESEEEVIVVEGCGDGISEAVIKYGKWDRCIGLCNVPTIAMMKEPIALNVDPNELIYQFVGLNHFHWHKVYDKDGNELTSKVIDAMLDGKDVGLPANINNVPFFGEQIREMNMIPCGYHRYYYRQQEMLEHSLMEYETIGTRGQQVKETENKLFELYKNPNLDHKPEELSKRGGAYYSDAACECINAIYNNKQIHMVVSTKNRGAIPELPEDSIVEVSCYIGAKGAMPVAWGKLPSAQRGWLQCMKAMEECTIEAAVTGNYGLALEAFTLNELIPSGENAKRVLDELLIAHKNYLPQFKSTIEKLEKENVTIKDSVVNEIIAHER